LSDEELAALNLALESAERFEFADSYESVGASDHASVLLSYRRRGHQKTVRHYLGDSSAPKALIDLEDNIDRVLDVERFTRHGPCGDLEQAQAAFHACYDHALIGDPGLSVKLMLKLHLVDGQVVKVDQELRSERDFDPEAHECIVASARKLCFVQATSEVDMPLSFVPRKPSP
jgi:hypothetical protein